MLRRQETRGERAVDLAAASTLIVLLAPLWLAIALLVKVTSRGRLFGQDRLGRRGAPFRMYKVRTMFADAEAILHSTPDLRARYVAR